MPLDQVWRYLRDPMLVASCVPGATLRQAESDGAYDGAIAVRFGPTEATFRGLLTLRWDDAAHRCGIDGHGTDQRGASRAQLAAIMTATGTDTTTVALDGRFKVTGPLSTFANAGGVHVANALMATFAENLARAIGPVAATGNAASAQAAAAQPAVAPAASRAAPLQAHVLLGAALKRWLCEWILRLRGRRQ